MWQLNILTHNVNLQASVMPHFHEPGRMCGTAMFALYCWASIDFYWGTHSQKKKEEKTKCLVLFIRGTDFFLFFSVSSSKGGRNGDGCRSYRLSILSVEPCVKRKTGIFSSFFFCCLHFVGVVLLQCVRQTGFNHEALCLIFCPYMHTIHPSIQHSNAST